MLRVRLGGCFVVVLGLKGLDRCFGSRSLLFEASGLLLAFGTSVGLAVCLYLCSFLGFCLLFAAFFFLLI